MRDKEITSINIRLFGAAGMALSKMAMGLGTAILIGKAIWTNDLSRK
jgi:hypothetical protein